MRRFVQFRSLWRQQGPLLALIVLISAVFLLQCLLPEDALDGYMVVPADVVTAWHSLRGGDFSTAGLAKLGSLVSYAFLHGGFDHLSGNMLFLWIFAALAVELVGWRWMLAVFAFTAITGGIYHVALNPEDTMPMLGASGTVTGFEGLYLAMATRWHLPNPHVWPMSRPIPPAQLALIGVIGLALDFSGFLGGEMGIAHGAHLGGFLGGLVMGGLVVPMPRLAWRR